MAQALVNTDWKGEARTFLILGRVSNLPTVWSNCLAGWLLGGGGNLSHLVRLCVGASCLYIGGMFLNDAYDSDFDRQFRKERPIPSGAITEVKVWAWGLAWLLAGVLLLSAFGGTSIWLTLLLASCILIYDAVHKAMTLSPLLMAACRFFLYLVAASVGTRGVTGLAIWSALALAGYIIGLSYIARKESARGPIRFWPVWPLIAPVLLAWVVNAGEYKLRSLACAMVLLGWALYCLRDTFWGQTVSVGRTVSGLLAGICLVDWLALAAGTIISGPVFVLLFIAAILLQRYVPAT